MSIFDLIDAGDAAGVERLLADDPGAAGERDEDGLSVLMRASYRGRGAVFEAIRAARPPLDAWDRLILGHADGLPPPEAWSPDGFAPLHLAAFAHNAAGTRSLLEQGADPNVIARASFARVTPLGTCAFVGATEVARILLEHGADPSRAEVAGGTPLAAARANRFDELVELLESATR